MPPWMSGSEVLTTWMFSTAMKAPISAPPTATRLRSGIGSAISAARAGIDGGFDRQAGAQLADQLRGQMQVDFHRHALHDFREIAGRVVGRQQREFLAGIGEH